MGNDRSRAKGENCWEMPLVACHKPHDTYNTVIKSAIKLRVNVQVAAPQSE